MTKIAAAQMNSSDNKEQNLQICRELIKKAAQKGASLVSLPENFAFFGGNSLETLNAAEDLDGYFINELRESAKLYDICLSLGGFQERIVGLEKIFNSHLIIDSKGVIRAKYRKIHLFNARLPDGTDYNESKIVKAGNEVVLCELPFFKAGLSICYDLRFSWLYSSLAQKGAQVLLIPAAFTHTTGLAHWEVLLRARAIENQSYVVAAAQVGKHKNRHTYGHAMIIDPWGKILSECSDNDDLAIAEVNQGYLDEVRTSMPVLKHGAFQFFEF